MRSDLVNWFMKSFIIILYGGVQRPLAIPPQREHSSIGYWILNLYNSEPVNTYISQPPLTSKTKIPFIPKLEMRLNQ